LFEEEDDYLTRVPELNPHAASFVPFSVDILPASPLQGTPCNPPSSSNPPIQQSFLRNPIGNDIPNAPQNNFNTIHDNHFNPEVRQNGNWKNGGNRNWKRGNQNSLDF